MSPDQVIKQLTEVLASSEVPFTEEDVLARVEQAGVPTRLADRAYKFAQLFVGRQFLDGMGIAFSNEYTGFNRNGEVIDKGAINDEPYFLAAQETVTVASIGKDAFTHFAMMSAELHATNDALNAGSKPSDIETSPAFMFFEPPTDDGVVEAMKVIEKCTADMARANPPQKPWWKFW